MSQKTVKYNIMCKKKTLGLILNCPGRDTLSNMALVKTLFCTRPGGKGSTTEASRGGR